MIAGENGARGRAALRPIEQSRVKVATASCDLKADWNLLAVDRGVSCPPPRNGTLGDGGCGEQEKTGKELHEMARFFLNVR
jgi:radical SAM superfamily enzyme